MLKKHGELLTSVLVVCDLAILCAAWFGAYYLRFHQGWLQIDNPHVPPLNDYASILLFMLLPALLIYRGSKLYEPRRISYFGKEMRSIVRATIGVILVFLLLDFFARDLFSAKYRFSRSFTVLFALLNTGMLTAQRATARFSLRQLRRHGRNLRRTLIVGAGKNGQSLARSIARNEWTGLVVKGYLDYRPERHGKLFHNVPVLGDPAELMRHLKEQNIDQVFIALPLADQGKIEALVNQLAEEPVGVFVVPDLFGFIALNSSIGDFEGIPIINLRETPLEGWNRVIKRAMDIALSLFFILLFSPFMLLLALLVKLSSPGPVFYTQERTGLDGRTFNMLKFRSMRMDAEAQTGAVWAKENDPRRTRLGTFMRKTSLDELPQFINVLLGHMSLVGPRPERPVFIEEFKKSIPKYALRHKVKSGVTGWAQVNGWRGNTSLKKRIQYDLYYIENWSPWFDLWIIFLTAFAVFRDKNAY